MNELALFAGAGGGILGGTLLGWRTVCAVEIDAYCAGILVQRQNDGILPAFPVWDDVRTFDGKPWRGIVDVVSGGFPCQDISCAGKGAGIEGERSGLWREFARIIGEVRPRYVFVENSAALVIRGLGRVLGDLAALGYNAEWGVLGARDVGAPHRRERIWIVADADRYGCDDGSEREKGFEGTACSAVVASGEQREDSLGQGNLADADGGVCGQWSEESQRQAQGRTPFGRNGEDVSDRDSERLEIRQGKNANGARSFSRDEFTGNDMVDADSIGRNGRSGEQWERRGRESQNPGWWQSEPAVGRVANELASRLDFFEETR